MCARKPRVSVRAFLSRRRRGICFEFISPRPIASGISVIYGRLYSRGPPRGIYSSMAENHWHCFARRCAVCYA